jgi:anthranilate synthase component 1
MYYPTLEEVKGLEGKGNLVPIYREIVADLETPVSAFLKVAQGGNSFLLESVEGGQRLARYSFIGTEPYRILTTKKKDNIDPLERIADELNKYKTVPVAGLPRFIGGAVGYLAYEVVTHFEELPSPTTDALDLPESLFMFVDTMLVFDHVTHRIKALSHVRLDGDIDTAYAEAVSRIDAMVARLNQPLKETQFSGMSTPQNGNRMVSNFPRTEFEKAVLKVKEYITTGEAIQVVLSQRQQRHRPLKSTVPCGQSILRPTCSSSTSANSRLLAPPPKCWSGLRMGW